MTPKCSPRNSRDSATDPFSNRGVRVPGGVLFIEDPPGYPCPRNPNPTPRKRQPWIPTICPRSISTRRETWSKNSAGKPSTRNSNRCLKFRQLFRARRARGATPRRHEIPRYFHSLPAGFTPPPLPPAPALAPALPSPGNPPRVPLTEPSERPVSVRELHHRRQSRNPHGCLKFRQQFQTLIP